MAPAVLFLRYFPPCISVPDTNWNSGSWISFSVQSEEWNIFLTKSNPKGTQRTKFHLSLYRRKSWVPEVHWFPAWNLSFPTYCTPLSPKQEHWLWRQMAEPGFFLYHHGTDHLSANLCGGVSKKFLPLPGIRPDMEQYWSIIGAAECGWFSISPRMSHLTSQ